MLPIENGAITSENGLIVCNYDMFSKIQHYVFQSEDQIESQKLKETMNKY